MNKILVAILSALLLVPVLSLAADAHHEDAKGGVASAQTTPSATSAIPATPTNPATMTNNMKQMQEQMAKLHAAKDPKERNNLLQEHMQTMHAAMKMMHSEHGMMSGSTTDSKQPMMMMMMQMMMDQMIEHNNAMQGMSN